MKAQGFLYATKMNSASDSCSRFGLINGVGCVKSKSMSSEP